MSKNVNPYCHNHETYISPSLNTPIWLSVIHNLWVETFVRIIRKEDDIMNNDEVVRLEIYLAAESSFSGPKGNNIYHTWTLLDRFFRPRPPIKSGQSNIGKAPGTEVTKFLYNQLMGSNFTFEAMSLSP